MLQMFPLQLEELQTQTDLGYMERVFVLDQTDAEAAAVRLPAPSIGFSFHDRAVCAVYQLVVTPHSRLIDLIRCLTLLPVLVSHRADIQEADQAITRHADDKDQLDRTHYRALLTSLLIAQTGASVKSWAACNRKMACLVRNDSATVLQSTPLAM